MTQPDIHLYTTATMNGYKPVIFNEEHLVSGAQGVDNYIAILRHLTENQAA